MIASEKPTRPPLVLIANDQEWAARSLESILGPSGYAVLHAYTGRQVLSLARSAQPDVVILDSRMSDLSGFAVCRQLRDDPQFASNVPIIVTTSDSVDRTQTLEAFRAGAWDFLGQPLDSDTLLLRIETYVRAKRDADRIREQSLVDQFTGLYNMRGLAQRAREIGAEASRQQHPLACVAFSPEAAPSLEVAGLSARDLDEIALRVVEHLAQVCRAIGRQSDVFGRVGQAEFAVVAPSTEGRGAVRLVERLQETLETTPLDLDGEALHVRIRAGYSAVPDFSQSRVDAVELLLRATTALRQARTPGQGDRIRAFEDLPV